jgi:hypothetical protein
VSLVLVLLPLIKGRRRSISSLFSRRGHEFPFFFIFCDVIFCTRLILTVLNKVFFINLFHEMRDTGRGCERDKKTSHVCKKKKGQEASPASQPGSQPASQPVCELCALPGLFFL